MDEELMLAIERHDTRGVAKRVHATNFWYAITVVSRVEALLRISRRGHSVMELHLPLVVAIPNGLFVEYIPVVEPRPNRTTEAGRWTLRIKRRTRVGHSFDWDRMQEF